jgi:hypothetical protein
MISFIIGFIVGVVIGYLWEKNYPSSFNKTKRYVDELISKIKK